MTLYGFTIEIIDMWLLFWFSFDWIICEFRENFFNFPVLSSLLSLCHISHFNLSMAVIAISNSLVYLFMYLLSVPCALGPYWDCCFKVLIGELVVAILNCHIPWSNITVLSWSWWNPKLFLNPGFSYRSVCKSCLCRSGLSLRRELCMELTVFNFWAKVLSLC